MIGSLLLLLGSAGYLATKTSNSTMAQQRIEANTKSLGLNQKRQFELEGLAIGANSYDRSRFISILEGLDFSESSSPTMWEYDRDRLVEKYKKYDDYIRNGYGTLRNFSQCIPEADKQLAVWLVSHAEGWVYYKKYHSELPPYCRGYDPNLNSTVRKYGKRI